MQELVEESSFHPPDIICVSDTGKLEFDLNGYTRYSFPCASLNQKHQNSKGVAIFVNSYYFLHACKRRDLSFSSDKYDDAWQDLWVEMNFWFFPSIVIGVIYKNPGRSDKIFIKFQQKLQQTISKIKRMGKDFFNLGDVNIDVDRQYDLENHKRSN